MKLYLKEFLLLSLILLSATGQDVTVEEGAGGEFTIKPQIVAEIRRIDPPLEPFVNTTLVISFRNAALSSGGTAAEAAEDVFVRLTPSCGIISPINTNIGLLAPGACSATTCVLSSPVDAVFDLWACEGSVRINFEYSFRDSEGKFHYSYGNIALSSGIPRLSVKPAKSTLPSAISTEIDLIINNEGSGNARNVRVTAFGDLIQIQGENTKSISQIPSHGQGQVNYKVSVGRPTATSVSGLQVEMTYEDTAGRSFANSKHYRN
jgi:hypothetical protein